MPPRPGPNRIDPLETDDPEIETRLSAWVVRATPEDPYTCANPTALLFQMETEWNTSPSFFHPQGLCPAVHRTHAWLLYCWRRVPQRRV